MAKYESKRGFTFGYDNGRGVSYYAPGILGSFFSRHHPPGARTLKHSVFSAVDTPSTLWYSVLQIPRISRIPLESILSHRSTQLSRYTSTSISFAAFLKCAFVSVGTGAVTVNFHYYFNTYFMYHFMDVRMYLIIRCTFSLSPGLVSTFLGGQRVLGEKKSPFVFLLV